MQSQSPFHSALLRPGAALVAEAHEEDGGIGAEGDLQAHVLEVDLFAGAERRVEVRVAVALELGTDEEVEAEACSC